MTHTEQRAKLAQLKAVCDALTAEQRRYDGEIAAGRIAIVDGTVHRLERKALAALPAPIEAHSAALDEIERLKSELACARGLLSALQSRAYEHRRDTSGARCR